MVSRGLLALALVSVGTCIGPLVGAQTSAASPGWPVVAAGYALDTLSYEGFSYGAGTLDNRNGGTGWADTWSPDGGPSTPFVTNQVGLTYAGLPTDDSSVRATGTSGNNSESARTLDDSLDGGVIYLQFLSIFQADHGGGTPNIRFYYEGTGTGLIGGLNVAGPSNNKMTLFNDQGDPVAITSAPLTQLNLTVVRIDHDANETAVWVNPDLATFDYAAPPAADALAPGFSPNIDQILIISRYGGDSAKDKFDEIRFMRLIAPPPPPPPPPAVASAAPHSVMAVPGDASVTVTWNAPESTGSFPISTYQATSHPGGKFCLTTELSCTIAGLSNGTAYNFTVRALTGAGWSPESLASADVKPAAEARKSAVIIGTREGRFILVEGTSTGLAGQGMTVLVRLSGGSQFIRGPAVIRVGQDGAFAWSRRTSKAADVFLESLDGSVRSNMVQFTAMRSP